VVSGSDQYKQIVDTRNVDLYPSLNVDIRRVVIIIRIILPGTPCVIQVIKTIELRKPTDYLGDGHSNGNEGLYIYGCLVGKSLKGNKKSYFRS
jgi:hypothetical protein